jgi:glycosyltransferase involved in cell wall biosynthesis
MINVDLVFSARLSSPNGDSRVVRTFLESTSFFRNNGIDLSITSSDIFHKKNVDQSKKTVKKTIKNYIKKFIPYSSYLTVRFLKSAEKNKENIIDYYLSQKKETDIVFFHELSTCYYYLKKRKNTKAKVVLVIHSNGDTFKMLHIYYPKLIKTKYYRYLLNVEKEVIDNVDKLGFVAQSAKEHFQELKPTYNNEKLFYVYNGIGNKPKSKTNKLFVNQPVKYVFYCAGSITKRKGQEIIIKAFQKLTEQQKAQFNITFLGDGAEKVRLENLVKHYKINKYIFFEGFVNDVTKYLEKSNGFILTSYDEGLPVSIIEALRLGLPIISTKVGGIPEMIEEGKNGFIIEPKANQLYDLFNTLHNFNLSEMGDYSLKIYQEKFTQEAMFRGYLKIFLSLHKEV